MNKVAWGLNTTVNKAIGKSPFQVMFGYISRGVDEAFLVSEVGPDKYEINPDTRHAGISERLSAQRPGMLANVAHRKSSKKDKWY